MTALEDYLEHSGVKGMKWGVRRARNAITVSSSKKAEKSLKSQGVISSLRKKATEVSDKVTGDGTSGARNVIGTGIHQASKISLSKSDKKANATNYHASIKVAKAIKRNDKYSAKLAKKASSSPKAAANAKAWEAYSKSYKARALSQSAKTSSEYAKIANNRQSMFNTRNETIKRINNNVYGKNAHGDTNQLLDTKANERKKQAKKAYKEGKKIYKAAKAAAVVAG